MTATVVGKMASQLICGIPVLGEAAASNKTVTLTAFYADVDLVTPRERYGRCGRAVCVRALVGDATLVS